MPSVTLRLSEWRVCVGGERLRYLIGPAVRLLVAHVDRRSVRVVLPYGITQHMECDNINDGMRIADEMLRKWVEEAGE